MFLQLVYASLYLPYVGLSDVPKRVLDICSMFGSHFDHWHYYNYLHGSSLHGNMLQQMLLRIK
tara:strand:- start:56 stop:244 length:189 start_codon:yes stop_codon:yes gene_type:complete